MLILKLYSVLEILMVFNGPTTASTSTAVVFNFHNEGAGSGP
jgi:hypothetical protein